MPVVLEKQQGFGTFKGVFVPSILTILGVIMYLRLGWVVGHLGFFASAVVITISSAITFLTGLSIAATASNMSKIKAGGAYFMVSRAFGLEAGAAIGLPLFLAQALGISFYIVGFAESIHFLFPSVSMFAVGFVSLIVLSLIAYTSADWALKTQFFILGLIVLSIISFLSGEPAPSTEMSSVEAVEVGQPFWVVFAVFFPAVTGILSGVSMSGDLKDPKKSLPIGTILAVVVGYFIYLLIAYFLDHFASREFLVAHPLAMRDISKFKFLFYCGLWGATLSSALGSLLGAPRTLQALALDRVLPQILGKGYGENNDPRVATVFTFFLAALGLWFGNLNLIAPILSMFFLTAYGALNLIAAVEGLIGNPSWRPAFRAPWYLSLLGAGGCFGTMFMINPGATIIAFFCCVGVYMLMRYRQLSAGWSDLRRGMLMYFARSSIYKLDEIEDDLRSWRPNLFVLSGAPTTRWHLIELANAISQGRSFLTVSSVILSKQADALKTRGQEESIRDFLAKRNVPALVKVKYTQQFSKAVKGFVEDYGLGSLSPNTFIMGISKKVEHKEEFCRSLMHLFQARKNVLMVKEGASHVTAKGAYQRSVIDVWWGRGKHQNATLMLILAYMMQSSSQWMRSTIRLRSIVDSEEEKQGVEENLKKFISSSRISASVSVEKVSHEDEIFSTIKKCSQDASLVFLGMREPFEDEDNESYYQYYQDLSFKLDTFPTTILTLAGEDVSFQDIFK